MNRQQIENIEARIGDIKNLIIVNTSYDEYIKAEIVLNKAILKLRKIYGLIK